MAEKAATENQTNDFVINYNSTPIGISKFKLALYSNRFRSIPEFLATNTFSVTGEIPFATFSEFMKGAQGEPFALTHENAYDILCLAEDWETPTLSKAVLTFLGNNNNNNNNNNNKSFPDCEKIIALLSEREKPVKNGEFDGQTVINNNSALEEVLARHLNVALHLPSFQNFSLSTLSRIFSQPNMIVNPHLLYTFIMGAFERYGQAASVLAPYLDIRQLTPEEADTFLNNSNLINSFVNDSLNAASIALMKENEALRQKESQTEDILKMILERLELLEDTQSLSKDESDSEMKELSRRIAVLENQNEDNFQRFSEVEISLNTLQETVKSQIDVVEKKAHQDVRKTNKIVNGLTRKSLTYDQLIADLRSDASDVRKKVEDVSKNVSGIKQAMTMMQEKNQIVKTVTIPFGGRSFNGIMRYLNDECNVSKKIPNAHLAEEVNITASTSDHNEPYQVIDMGWNDFFFTENLPQQWIQIDFKNKMVRVTHYTIKTHRYPGGAPHIKSWVVEGSADDGSTWTELDKRAITVLNGPNRYQTFPIMNKSAETYRLIRLKQTASNTRKDNILALTNFELFGQLYIPDE